MRWFTAQIALDDAQRGDSPASAELVYMLKDVANRLNRGGAYNQDGRFLDSEGITVGHWSISEDTA